MSNRSNREKNIYNKGFDEERKKYDSAFGHAKTKGYYGDYSEKLISDIMKNARGKNVLEFGSSSWINFIDFTNYPPSKTVCINISETELQKGINLYNKKFPSDGFIYNDLDFQFNIMDAHKLKFPDESFDIVFGIGILHHLDFEKAVQEIYRILKKDGFCLFIEPVGCNIIGKIVRKLTPKARTA